MLITLLQLDKDVNLVVVQRLMLSLTKRVEKGPCERFQSHVKIYGKDMLHSNELTLPPSLIFPAQDESYLESTSRIHFIVIIFVLLKCAMCFAVV